MRGDLHQTGEKIQIPQKESRICQRGLKSGEFSRARRNLVVVGGVSLDAVSHEESVGARGDEGMTRSHNLKAQEAECT